MSVKAVIKNSLAYAEYVASKPIYGIMARRLKGVEGKGHILITAPGQGNIGDQAMLEAVLENTKADIRVVVRRSEDVVIPKNRADRVSVVALPNLIYGNFNISHLRDVRQLLRLLRQSDSLSLIGADIMDGAYNPRASVRRASMLRLARRVNVNARVLGFSWNGHASWPALAALREASSMNVQLMLRDPVSAERARRDGLANVTEVSDLVFSATDVDTRLADHLALSRGPVALVNISAHIEKSISQHDEYLEIISDLKNKGFHVVLVPHVSRPGSDDLPSTRRLYEAVGPDEVSLVDRICSPAEIRGLCRRATIVVTGRMHLSIIALSQGVPAVVLSSQGKVEGLQRRVPNFARSVDPEVGFSRAVIRAVNELVQQEFGKQNGMIDEQRRLALVNFS